MAGRQVIMAAVSLVGAVYGEAGMAKKKTGGLSRTEAARVHRLLGDENRLQLLEILAERGEARVGVLCEAVGLSQPSVSHHLALLRMAGLVDCRRDGKGSAYRITSSVVLDMLRVTSGA